MLPSINSSGPEGVKESGILLSVTVLFGIGGVELSHAHAEDTGKVLSEMDPDYVGALSLIVVPGTSMEDEIETGKLVIPTLFGVIRELGMMISNCPVRFFASNHASNYLPLRIRMPGEKEKALQLIQAVLRRKDPECSGRSTCGRFSKAVSIQLSAFSFMES